MVVRALFGATSTQMFEKRCELDESVWQRSQREAGCQVCVV